MEEAMKLHREWYEELERQAKLAEAAQVYAQSGESGLKELLAAASASAESPKDKAKS